MVVGIEGPYTVAGVGFVTIGQYVLFVIGSLRFKLNKPPERDIGLKDFPV
jgi:hypothetical protein